MRQNDLVLFKGFLDWLRMAEDIFELFQRPLFRLNNGEVHGKPLEKMENDWHISDQRSRLDCTDRKMFHLRKIVYVFQPIRLSATGVA